MNNLSNIALGTWLFGGLRWGHVDPDTSYRTMCEAIERGIKYFDTSDAYGKGYSEELIGRLPKSLKQKIKVMTKSGVVWDADGTRHVNINKDYVLGALTNSLNRLDIDQIEVYYLHEDDESKTVDEISNTLEKVLETGNVRYLGLSNFSEKRVAEISSRVPIYSVQNECNPLEIRETVNTIKAIKRKGMQFHCYGLLSKGLLSGKLFGKEEFQTGDNRAENKEFLGDRFVQNIVKVDKLKESVRHTGIPLAPLVIYWAIKYCEVDLAIIGCRNVSQLNEVLDYVNNIHNLDVFEILTDSFYNW